LDDAEQAAVGAAGADGPLDLQAAQRDAVDDEVLRALEEARGP
jgi:hypothetical protein